MGESYFWKPFAQGVATPIVLIGGTNLLLKDFKVSNPYLYWGGLAASSAVVVGILADKIKVPILNAESFGAEMTKVKITAKGGKETMVEIPTKIPHPFENSTINTKNVSENAQLESYVGDWIRDNHGDFYDFKIMGAESDNCPICKGDIYGDMSMIGEEIVPDICGDCDIYVMPQGSDFKVRCIECGYGDIYGSRTPCEECESIADKIEVVNNETFNADIDYSGAKRYVMALDGRFDGANDEGYFPVDEEDFSEMVVDEIGEHTILDAETSEHPKEYNEKTGIGWAKSYLKAKKENPYKNIDWYLMMGNGERKTIKGVEYIIFSDNSALKSKKTWIDGELDDVEWVLASPTRIDKTSGKGVYEAETFEAPKDPPYVINGRKRIMTWKEVARGYKKEYDYENWREADKQIDYLKNVQEYLEECNDEEFEGWFRNIDDPSMSNFAFDYKGIWGNNTDRDERMKYMGHYINMLRQAKEDMFPESFYDAETFNSDSHTDSFMADMPVNAVKNEHGEGWTIDSVHRRDYKETFKNWKPSKYPYEKRITQDSVNETCNSCGKENVHYQFYLPRTNSVNPKIRFIDSATYCQYDPNTCGGNICRDCADNNDSCENCGAEICSFCEEENNYEHSDLVCVDCREFNESLEDD
jgi:hypothetical protein